MSHEIERNDHYVGGESVVWGFTIEDDGSTKDISSASVEWYLLESRGQPNEDALLDHTDSGITAQITDGPNGEAEVKIESGVTDSYSGSRKWQRFILEDSSGNVQIWRGPFPIQER